MSADYNFWKYKQDVVHEDEKVYASLCDGEQLEDLQSLPIEKIRERICAVFPVGTGWIGTTAKKRALAASRCILRHSLSGLTAMGCLSRV